MSCKKITRMGSSNVIKRDDKLYFQYVACHQLIKREGTHLLYSNDKPSAWLFIKHKAMQAVSSTVWAASSEQWGDAYFVCQKYCPRGTRQRQHLLRARGVCQMWPELPAQVLSDLVVTKASWGRQRRRCFPDGKTWFPRVAGLSQVHWLGSGDPSC